VPCSGGVALFVGRHLLALIPLSGRETCCCVREAVWCVLVCPLSGEGLTRQACCECVLRMVLAADCKASPLSAGQTGRSLTGWLWPASVRADVCGIPPRLMGQASLYSAWPLMCAATTGCGLDLCPPITKSVWVAAPLGPSLLQHKQQEIPV